MNQVEILTTKVGLSPVQAAWAMNLSDKHAIWIGNQIKTNPEIFINPKGENDIKEILGWKKDNPGLNIKEYDYKKAMAAVKKSKKAPFKIEKGSLKNKKVVAVCHGSQYKWVALKTKTDCTEEGRYMNHCLSYMHGSYLRDNTPLFSLRDEYNKPVMTIQVRKRQKDITQYSANSNYRPAKKFGKYLDFLEEQAGVKISPSAKYHQGIISIEELKAIVQEKEKSAKSV